LWSGWLGQNTLDWSLTDIALPVGFSFFAFFVWLVKWCWQLHPRRRWPALAFGLRWLRAQLGVWLIMSSWLYLTLLLIAAQPGRAVGAQIEKAQAPLELRGELSSRGAPPS
jgi:hypothetical protein